MRVSAAHAKGLECGTSPFSHDTMCGSKAGAAFFQAERERLTLTKFMPQRPVKNCAGMKMEVTSVRRRSTRFCCSSWILR